MRTELSGTITADQAGVWQGGASQPTEPQAMSMENPAFNLDAADVLTGEGTRSAAGVRVTPEKTLGIPAVFQAVSMISGDVARLPLTVYLSDENDFLTPDRSHPAFALLKKRPNETMHAHKFWRRIVVFLLLWQNAYAWIRRRGDGTPAELLLLLPDRTKPERLPDGRLVYVTEYERGKMIALQPSEVLHFEGVGLNNLHGSELIALARDALGMAIAASTFASKFFANGGRIGGILEIPAATSTQAKARIEEGFRRVYEGIDAAFKTVVLRDSAKFHAGQLSASETQLADARREQVREVARLFNMRPSRLGEESGSGYNSKAEDNRDYLERTLTHPMTAIATECEAKLLTTEEFLGDTHTVAHDTSELLRMDPLRQMQFGSLGVRSELMTRNEARRQLRLPPVDGGDEIRNPAINPGGNQAADQVDQQAAAARLRACHRSGLVAELQRALAVVGTKAQRAAKRGLHHFDSWTKNTLPGELAAASDGARPLVAAHATASGGDCDLVHAHLAARLAREATTTLQGVNVHAADLVDEVKLATADCAAIIDAALEAIGLGAKTE